MTSKIAVIFTGRLKRGFKVAQYLPSLIINYVAINKNLEKVTTTALLDKDENLL